MSLYNETDGRAILPTPTIAAVGLRARRGRRRHPVVQAGGRRRAARSGTRDREARRRASAGASTPLREARRGRQLGGPAAAHRSGGRGEAPEARARARARARASRARTTSSDGGLAVALAECATSAPSAGRTSGADRPRDVRRRTRRSTPPALLFGEAPSRVVVSVAREPLAECPRRPREAAASRARSSASRAATRCRSRSSASRPRGVRGHRREPVIASMSRAAAGAESVAFRRSSGT